MFQHLIFDLDGTILDTNETILRTFEYTLKHHLNYDVKRSELMKVFGQPLEKQMAYFSPGLADLLCKTYREYYAEHDHEWTKPFPGVTDALTILKNHGVKMGVATNKYSEPAIKALKEFGLWPYFEYTICGDEVTNHKPHPEALLRAAELMKVTPAETLMIGDSPLDIEAAHHAKMKSALVSWTIFPAERFAEYPADYRLNQLHDLVKILNLDVA